MKEKRALFTSATRVYPRAREEPGGKGSGSRAGGVAGFRCVVGECLCPGTVRTRGGRPRCAAGRARRPGAEAGYYSLFVMGGVALTTERSGLPRCFFLVLFSAKAGRSSVSPSQTPERECRALSWRRARRRKRAALPKV
ncbi:hypothetical protein AAFF_G00025330 [Aldrovandia affinis]|uniref:Uncharacterized protein n=1 Tax=Aldrovandia affinis TaxID=143900 RepID=A0AAD7S4V1_9TELE|nr:hypothetical protein AAFF_G00025330 [Aldrovandia affinis]